MHQPQNISDDPTLDILVLHVENGRDIFISINGKYKPSCFGFSMLTLMQLPNPVHEMSLAELIKIVEFYLIAFIYYVFFFFNNKPNYISCVRNIIQFINQIL